MSWHYSAVLVEDCLARGCLDGNQCAELKTIRTAGRSSFAGKRRATWNPFPCGTMSELSTANRGVELWIASLRDSRANHSVLQEIRTETTTSGICGRRPSESFAKWDHGSASWRTYPALFASTISARSSGTWQMQGSMRNGVLYRRIPLVPCTTETESGYVPTPAACDYKGAGRPRKNRGPGNNLRDWFRQNYGFLYPPVPVVEWLMGWPIGWTDLKPLETGKFRQWLELHGSC